MDFNKSLLPISKKIDGILLSDKLIGMRPDEIWDEAVRRYTVEQRVKKINKIRNKIKKGS